MEITNLADSPLFIEQARILIEKEFGYTASNSFAIDFYPLFNKDNFKNCYILVEEDKVLAHIGCKLKALNVAANEYTMVFYGGIAVKSTEQGKGLFKKLFNYVLKQNQDVSLHLLWSEKLELYQKFNFYPAINLFHYNKDSFQHSFKVEKLNMIDIHQINHLYKKNNELRVTRSESDWEELAKITSANLYLIKKDQETINYFIKDKGADLTNIIHEYGHMDKEQLEVMLSYDDVWSTYDSPEIERTAIYSSVVRAGEESIFKAFIKDLTDIEIVNINNESISFQFEGNIQELPIKDFLTGALGPARFKELSKKPEIFISGLDSI